MLIEMKKQILLLMLIFICFHSMSQWDFVGSATVSNEWTVDNDIKIDTSGSPVIIYYGSSSNKASCLRFNGTQWEQVGNETFNNFSIGTLLDFEIDNKNNYYILYLDPDYKTSCIRFNGNSWEFVGSPYISTEYSPYKSMAIDTAGIVYVALQTQSAFSIVKEKDETWIPVSVKGLPGVDRNFDLVFDNENIAFLGYCGMNGMIPNCAKLLNDNWVSVGSAISSTYFSTETHLLITKDHQMYMGFLHQDMGFYEYDVQANTWINIETADLGEYFAGIEDIVSDSNSNIYISIWSDRARCFKHGGSGWEQIGSFGISESEAGYPKIAINKDDILYATYNDWISGKAVVKKYVNTTGIDNVLQDDLFKIYPNPVKDHFCIELTGQKFTVTIYDTKGKLIFENANAFDIIEFNANVFNKGIYIVRAKSGDETFHYQKLIVM